MVISCVAWRCTNRQEDEDGNKLTFHGVPVSFHRFPNKTKDRQLHLQWINSVKRWKWKPTNFSYICSLHFLINDYKVPPWEERPRLKKNTVPSVFKQYPEHLQPSTKKRKTKNSTRNDDAAPLEHPSTSETAETLEDPPVPVAVERERSKRKRIEKDMKELKRKYKTLQQKLRRKEKKN